MDSKIRHIVIGFVGFLHEREIHRDQLQAGVSAVYRYEIGGILRHNEFPSERKKS